MFSFLQLETILLKLSNNVFACISFVHPHYYFDSSQFLVEKFSLRYLFRQYCVGREMFFISINGCFEICKNCNLADVHVACYTELLQIYIETYSNALYSFCHYF